jgi:signal transduction histidine kinase/ActR/RegA family two-component response regulator
MPAAPLPPNEADRLAELKRYNILDTEREAQFDDLTFLAKQICQTPVALISLVDKDRQWFKSCFGIDACQTPREQAFCAYTILTPEQFIVTDATTDPRVSDNLLVLHPPQIRFYAGIPLKTPRGYNLGSLCVIDFVPRKISEEQLHALKILAKQVVLLLEARIYEAEIKEYARSLEAVSQSKSRFIATLSHEIRTPLNGVLGALQLLGETAIGPVQMEYFKIAQTCGKSILTLINDVLDLAKIEAGKVELVPQPTNLYSVVEEVKTIVKPLLKQKALNLVIDYDRNIPEYLSFDPDRLRQILINLTGNGIKFSPHEADLTLRFILQAKTDQTATITVQVVDHGIGLSEEEKQRILIPFAQASATTAKTYGGTGLGLSIVNELLGLMGSQLEITSQKGNGATFSFSLSLPIAEAPIEPVPTPDQPKIECRSFNVLLAEDEPVNQLIISRSLQKKGHKVTVTKNGQEALDRFRVEDFDIVLLDLEMPIMGGEETARFMRQIKPHVPILGISGHVLSDVKQKVGDLMDDYLTKPIDLRVLEETMQKIKAKSTPIVVHTS